MLPENLACQAEVLYGHPNGGWVFTNIETVKEAGQVVGGHWTRDLPQSDTIFPGMGFVELTLRAGNVVPCPAVMAGAACYR